MKADVKTYPSIFNDVIGPVMRGPSSSHCAAALRIGRLARDLMDGRIEEVLVEFDSQGALATTHQSHGSDMGLFGGLLGLEAADDRLKASAHLLQAAGIKVKIEIAALGDKHPSTYRLTLRNAAERHTLTAISTGGGMIEVTEIDGAQVSLAGDYYETLIYLDAGGEEALQFLRDNTAADEILLLRSAGASIIEIKAQDFLDEKIVAQLNKRQAIKRLKKLSPVLPVLSRRDMSVPFITCQELLAYNKGKDLQLWELAARYESARGNLSPAQVLQKMKELVLIMQTSIHEGLAGTRYADRILGYQSGLFRTRMEDKQLLDGGLLNRMILYVTALMEIKSSLGVIVAAPTAGACAGLPGACIGAAEALGLSADEMAQGLLAAGMIGVFIAAHSTFAAEVCGCQAECGAASGMAAAALVTLAKGTAKQALSASSLALQSTLGMVCGPVANRVEVPCLGNNVLAAANAFACANMALADYDPVIPLDEVIETMDRVGKSLPHELRCTALGGLSITQTSKAIEERLKQHGAA